MSIVAITLAALGGAALGGAAAWLLSASSRGSGRRELIELDSRLRRIAVPVLERVADRLGVPASERQSQPSSAVELVVDLARSIERHEERVELPYTDTLEVERERVASAGRRS